MKTTRLLFWAAVGLMMTTPVWAGVLMTMIDQQAGRADDQTTLKTYLDKDRLRTETISQNEHQAIIFRAEKGLFWVIDLKDKTYTEFTRKDLESMRQKMEETSKEMEAALQNMPPEQRKMMAEHMKGMMPATAPKWTYNKVASGQKVGSWTCTQYEGATDGSKGSDVWTTDWKSLGLTAEDFKILKDMSRFWEDLAPSSTFFKIGEANKETEGQLSGIPVKTVYYSGGKVSSASELKDVHREDFEAALFELPSGLKKQEPPHGGMHE